MDIFKLRSYISHEFKFYVIPAIEKLVKQMNEFPNFRYNWPNIGIYK